MRGTKFSRLRTLLIAYAKGHNNRINLSLMDGLGQYSQHDLCVMLMRMHNEGIIIRVRLGVYCVN